MIAPMVKAFYYKWCKLRRSCCGQGNLFTRFKVTLRTFDRIPAQEVDESGYIEQDNTSPIKKKSR